MFEVGVSDSVKNLDKLKKDLDAFIQHYSKEAEIQLRININDLNTVTSALSKIGDSPQLRNLRQEIEAINKEFAKFAAGAGGVGDIQSRGAQQEVAGLRAELDSADRKLRNLIEDLDVLRRNRDMARPEDKGNYTMPMKALKEQIAAQEELVKKRQAAYDQAVADAGKTVEANNSASASYRELKKSIDEMKASLSNPTVNTSNDAELKKLQSDLDKVRQEADASQKTITELTEKLNNMATAQNKVADATAKTSKSEQQIGDSQQAMFNRYQKLLSDIQNIKREIVDIQRGTGGGPFGSKLGEYYSALNQIRNSVREITSAPSVAEALQRGMNSERLSKLTSALAAIKSDMKDTISEAKAFNKEVDKGSSQAEARIKKLGMAFNELKNYMKANGGSEEMKRLQQEIQVAIQRMRQLMNAGDYSGAVRVFERISGMLRQAAMATKEYESSQSGLASAVNKSTRELMGQSQVLNDLKTLAMQYLSIWGAQSFINNIIELGGQLEQQRLSIGAILQDTAQANHLFGQIKDLAIKSPFGVQQLDAMTKQLSAYGFQYSELYEWTKRLADISAATGTSVDRLALALGHVRSEGALSGYTLRQFSMGNIPLLEKLSKNLGKTKQEIRKMTRNKEIGYEDVLNVLKQLTDEGGMFFEAQETMAQALNAKFKNLRDSFQIMYSEMAEGAPGDFLKRVAEVMTDISKSWRVLMPLVISGGAALGVWKLATMALNYQLEHTGKLLVGNALATSKYSVNQLRAIATTGRFTVALRGLGRALMGLAKFVFNPVTLGFAAVEGLIYLWSKHNDEVRKAKDLTKEFSETAVESQKNIGKELEEIKPYTENMDDSLLKTSIETMTESLKNYGVNAQKVLNEAFGKDSEGNVMSLAEKYKYLRNELEKTKAVYEEMEKTAGAFEYGINETSGSWLDENVETDISQYAKSIQKFEDEVTKYSEKYGDAIKKAIDAAEAADPAFRRATVNMTTYGQKLAEFWENQDEYRLGIKAASYYMRGADSEGIANLQEGYADFLKSKGEALRELDKFFDATEARLKEAGYRFEENGKHLSESQVGALLKESKLWMEKHPEWENIYDVIKKKLKGRWGIEIVPDVEPIEEELPEWMQRIQEELDAKKTGIQIKAGMSMEQIIEEARKAYQTAETTINKLGPIAINAGIKLEGLTDEDVAKYGPMSENYNPELYSTLLDLKKKQDAKGMIDAFGKKRGLNFKGMKKDGSHKAEKQNQESAKAVREQVRVIKEAADAFQYWREKVGDKGAWEHVQAEFGDVLNKIGITASNIEDVRGHLNNISKTKEYKAITDKKVKTEIDKEVAKENDQFIRKDFEKSTDEWASALTRDIDELTRKWEIFNSVVSDTGDRMLAARLTGITPGATPADLKRLNLSSFAGVNIDFDRVLGMSEEEIDKYVYSLGLVEEKIKAVQDGLKDWKKAQEDITTSDIQNYAKWLGSLVDLESIRQRNQEEYNRVLEETNRLLAQGIITQEEANRRNKNASDQRDYKDWTSTSLYTNLYNNAQVMSQFDFLEAFSIEMEHLKAQFDNGDISLQQYAEKVDKLNQIASEFKTTGFLGIRGGVGAYLSGGVQGLLGYYKNRATQSRVNGEEEDADKWQERYDSLNKLQMTAEQVAKAFSDLSSGADMLANLFSALGMEGASNAFGGAASVLGGIGQGASSLSAFGPYGMAAGAVLGGLTSIAQLHDKSIQREIDAIQDNVDSIKANTDAIKSARERTLGYDYGRLRSQMAGQYTDTKSEISLPLVVGKVSVTDSAKEAMQEYYKRNSARSGYAAELENLKAMREGYIEMYNLEESKKDASQDALDEYKEKIAELDDQILFFVEDLANELWGIDFESWASQISDALWTAFENGEDALDAFHDAAKDIISDVAKRMMNIHLIEPKMAELEEMLFGRIGENGQRTGGVYNTNTGQFDENETLRILGQFFGEDGEFAKVISSAEDFYKMAERASGIDFSAEESGSSTSSSIKGITEQTADLLSSYVNACRADLSVVRNLQGQYFPMFYASITSGNASLVNIQQNTAAIMRSNDAIERSNQAILENINGLKNKTWKVPMA